MNPRHLILGFGAALTAFAAACGSIPGENAASSASAGGASAARGAVGMQQYQTRQQAFERLDSNHSGAISRTEALESPPLMVIFVEMDANSDGELSTLEWSGVPLANPDGTRVP